MQGNWNQFKKNYFSMLNVQPEGGKKKSLKICINKNLDHLYSTHRRIQSSSSPSIWQIHNSILLISAYKQKLKQEAPVTR
jgi:hypothetical protein